MIWEKKQPQSAQNSTHYHCRPFWWVIGPLLFLLGMAAGAILCGCVQGETLSHLDFLFQTDFKLRMEDPFTGAFVSSTASSFLLMAFCYLNGMALWGILLLPVAPLLRGIGVGLIAGHLYAGYGMTGICFFLFAFLPGALISSMGIFLAVQESWNLGKKLLYQEKPVLYLGKYSMRFGLFMIPCLIGAVADWLSAIICSSFFSF